MIRNRYWYIGLYVKYLPALYILIKFAFPRQIFEKKNLISNFMKIRPVGAELFHANRRTEGQTDWRTNGQT